MKYKPNHKAGKLVKINSYAQGGSVMRSESTEAAKAERKAKDRTREFEDTLDTNKYDYNKSSDRAQSRVDSALRDRAMNRAISAINSASQTASRTGYQNMGDRSDDDSVVASERLKRSPVNIGKDDD